MKIGILGAGIAGLASAHFLRDTFPDLQVHEATTQVGGLARSFKWHGFDCDLAPHRLYTQDAELLAELLALVEMARVRRRSSIYLQGKWIRDPVNAVEMVLKFLPRRSARIVWSYLFRRDHGDASFESLVLTRFGAGLNEMFFKPYSEKLFGIPAGEISAEWGRRKIRVAGLRDMVRRESKLYFKEFYYPRSGGYGAITQRLYEEVKDSVRLDSRLVAVRRDEATNRYVCQFTNAVGEERAEEFDALVTSLPLDTFARLFGLELSLRFRPARITYLLIDKDRVTDNHWFYFADRDFILNRVAEFKNFSGAGTLPAGRTVLCCEVTDVARYSPERVISELTETGIIKSRDVLDTKVIELANAYPVYDRGYEEEMRRAHDFFAAHPEIQHVGRHAQFAHKDIDEIFDEAKQLALRLNAQHATHARA
jgi:protoporphyrinogen oxidase